MSGASRRHGDASAVIYLCGAAPAHGSVCCNTTNNNNSDSLASFTGMLWFVFKNATWYCNACSGKISLLMIHYFFVISVFEL